jgi:two-component system sensor histidine kinase TctE
MRLTLLILVPLIGIAMLVGTWAYLDAQSNAAARFDRSLLSTALAISRDTAVSGGDALSEETRDLLRDTSGGAVFYHVYAPDGVFVTGYATPPIPPSHVPVDIAQTYYDAIYQDAKVRALRFTQSTSIDGLTGLFTFTVWQQTAVRDGFVQTRTNPMFLIITSMIGALALIVWFGVRLGLTPLTDLEEAIARRSANDLSTIKRRIPPEVGGIVGRFNALLLDLSSTLDAKNAFISDAAHQLRNPIAGVLSLAESVQGAKTMKDVQNRTTDLLDAARATGKLANNLLTLERAQAQRVKREDIKFDPSPILQKLAAHGQAEAQARGITFEATLGPDLGVLSGDPVMFEQALLNLINNAYHHGGPTLKTVKLIAQKHGRMLNIVVCDDGKGIAQGDQEKALGRFSQIGPSAGSGLGLPIAKAVTETFGGDITLTKDQALFSVQLSLPSLA